jgi:hypothetical protein
MRFSFHSHAMHYSFFISLCTVLVCGVALAEDTPPQAKAAVAVFEAGPSAFIENAGQWPDADIGYALDSRGVNVGLTAGGIRFQVFREAEQDDADASAWHGHPAREEDPSRNVDKNHQDHGQDAHATKVRTEFRVNFDGAAQVLPQGRDRAAQTYNYLVGDVSQQREAVHAYESVWYRDLYPGIDLELQGTRTGLKYNFHVAPGADYRVIRLHCDGIETLALREDGSLAVHLPAASKTPSLETLGAPPSLAALSDDHVLIDATPYIYQERNGQRIPVSGGYVLHDDHTYGFALTGSHDPALPLVIDPEVAWGTYLGGNNDDYGTAVAVDASGNVYVTGYTRATGWVSGGWDTSLDGDTDGYVVKLSPSGAHQWSTYLGVVVMTIATASRPTPRTACMSPVTQDRLDG